MSQDLRWKDTRVLVTGAGGFLGGAVSRRLLNQGARVHGTFHSPARPVPAGITGHPMELTEPEGLEALIAACEPDVVIHLAAPIQLTRDPAAFPPMTDAILRATDAVARACLRQRARLLYAGTCEEYGDGEAPFLESQAPRPVSPYSAAKAAASHWVGCLSRTTALEAVVVRPFLTYGPGQRGSRLIPSAVRAALEGRAFPMTDGLQTREVNYVEDMARGITLAAGAGAAVGRLLNLGGGPELTVLSLVQRIFALCEADPALVRPGALSRRAGEVATRFVGDHALARSLLGFSPEVSLDEGLRRTIQATRSESARRSG